MAMIAIAGDDAVLAGRQRRLQPDRDRLLTDIEMAETADQAEPIKLPGALLEAPDEEHLPIIFEQFRLRGLVALGLGRSLAIRGLRRRRGGVGFLRGALRRCCPGHSRPSPLIDKLRLYGGKRRSAQRVP